MMAKKLIFILFSISIIFELNLQGQLVKLEINAPNEITAGETVEINIQISKGNLSGFARLQQTFPNAVNIKPKESAGADFSFTDGKLNIIWLNLPDRPEINISYTLTTDEKVKGDLVLSGRFSYIVQNDRAELEMKQQTLRINPSPLINENQIVDIYKFSGKRPGSEAAKDILPIGVFREKPYLAESSDGWIVNILISRGEIEKLARIEETVPPGFSVENIEGHNAIFSFKGGVVKYLWMTFPHQQFFIISYKLIPGGGTSFQPPDLKGVLSYMINDAVKSITIAQKDDQFHSMNRSALSNLIASYSSVKVVQPTQKPVAVTTTTKPATKPAAKPVAKPVTKPKTKPKVPVTSTETTRIISKPLPSESGVYYRIQLLATNKTADADNFLSAYNFGEIYKESHAGLYKYSTGKFLVYKDAKAYLRDLVSKTKIKEAFVTAYQDGKRIPDKEALRLTNQKWVK